MSSSISVIEGSPGVLPAVFKILGIPVAYFGFQGENSKGDACKIAAVHSPHELVEGILYCLGIPGRIGEEILFIVITERSLCSRVAKGFSFRMPRTSPKSQDSLVGAGVGQGPR